MKFWMIMFFFTLLIPLTMIIYGAIYTKKGPKKVNRFSGYRTDMSMKNEETWKFAHQHFGKIWLVWGLLLLIITVPINFIYMDGSNNTVGLVGGVLVFFQMIVMAISNIPTSRALKKTFDDNGNYKEKINKQ